MVRATAQGQEGVQDAAFTRLQETTIAQSNTIKSLQQEIHDRDRKNDEIISHYEELVRMGKDLARDAEEAERKAEAEVGTLIEELERLQALLTAHGIEF